MTDEQGSGAYKEDKREKRVLIWGTIIGVLLLYLNTCTVQLPFVVGRVVDQATGKPVADAWVWATLSVDYRTVAGRVSPQRRVSPAHLRTNANGRFLIPYDMFFSPPPPLAFGVSGGHFKITVRTFDDRYAQMDFTGRINRWRFVTFITIPVGPYPLTGRERAMDLSNLFSYCRDGRYFIETPSTPGGCDDWERDYLIRKNERIVEQIGPPITNEEEGIVKGALKRLGYLYEQRGDFEKALETFRAVHALDLKRGVDLSIKEYKNKIRELEQKLNNKE